MQMALIPLKISDKVLTVAPDDYVKYTGGIGYLVNVYSKKFESFKYLQSHKRFKNKWLLVPFFLIQYLKFLAILTFDRKIKIVHIHGASYGSFYRKYFL